MSVSNPYLNSFFNKLMKNNVTYRSFEYNLKAKQLNNTKNINKFKSFYKLLIKEGYDKNIVETFFKDKRNIIDLLLSKYLSQRKKIFSNWYSLYRMEMNIPNPPKNEPSILNTITSTNESLTSTKEKQVLGTKYSVPPNFNPNKVKVQALLNELSKQNINFSNVIDGGSKKRIKKTKKKRKLKQKKTKQKKTKQRKIKQSKIKVNKN